MFDNKIFNVNGKGPEMLEHALALAFEQLGEKTTAKAWKFVPEKGLVLYWHASKGDGNLLPAPMTAKEVAPLALKWLAEDNAMTCSGWDANFNHDGHNGTGWRVYSEDWGHVGNDSTAICAVRPVFLWYGK